MAEKHIDMAKCGFLTLLLRLSLPTVAVMLVMVLYNMADIFFIGQAGNPAQVAAIALAGPLFGALQGLGTLLGSGGCTVAALALGAGEKHKLNAVYCFCLYATLGLGALVALASAFFAPEIAGALGASGEVCAYAGEYIRIVGLGAPAVLFLGVFSNVMRADGSMRDAVISTLTGTVANIALDPIFISVLGMGVGGAAIATVLGSAAGCAVALWHMVRRPGGFFTARGALRGEGRACLSVLALGLPLAISTLLGSCASALGNSLFMRYGADVVAANGVAGRFGMLTSMITMGICMGLQPAISFNYARGDIARVKWIFKNAAAVALAAGALFTAVCYIWRSAFIGAFISDANVMTYGVRMLEIMLILCPAGGIYQLCTALLQATGNAPCAIALSVLRQCALYLPCMYLLDRLWGLSGLMYAGVAADALALAVALMLTGGWFRRVGKPSKPLTAAGKWRAHLRRAAAPDAN